MRFHPVFAIAPEIDFYLRPAMEFSWKFDDAGITLSDINKCPTHILTGEVEYENTLDCDISYGIARDALLILGLSNAFAWGVGVSWSFN
jgi:hypothetical protein